MRLEIFDIGAGRAGGATLQVVAIRSIGLYLRQSPESVDESVALIGGFIVEVDEDCAFAKYLHGIISQRELPQRMQHIHNRYVIVFSGVGEGSDDVCIQFRSVIEGWIYLH